MSGAEPKTIPARAAGMAIIIMVCPASVNISYNFFNPILVSFLSQLKPIVSQKLIKQADMGVLPITSIHTCAITGIKT